MTIEQYERTKEQNKSLGVPDVSMCGTDKQKENINGNVSHGSPLPKHRRQQQLQEDSSGSRGIGSIHNTQSIWLLNMFFIW